jgi:hypothetical protein
LQYRDSMVADKDVKVKVKEGVKVKVDVKGTI